LILLIRLAGHSYYKFTQINLIVGIVLFTSKRIAIAITYLICLVVVQYIVDIVSQFDVLVDNNDEDHHGESIKTGHSAGGDSFATGITISEFL